MNENLKDDILGGIREIQANSGSAETNGAMMLAAILLDCSVDTISEMLEE